MILQRELGIYAKQGIRIYGSFLGQGASQPINLRDGNAKVITGVTRVSAGLFTVQMRTDMPIPKLPVHWDVHLWPVSVPTVDAEAFFVNGSYSQHLANFQIVVRARGAAVPGWQTGLAVSSNSVTLPNPGPVVAVQATTGTTVGPKSQLSSGTPATGQCTVTYSAAGVPTITFATADAVTVAAVTQVIQGVVDPDSGARISFEAAGSIDSVGVDKA